MQLTVIVPSCVLDVPGCQVNTAGCNCSGNSESEISYMHGSGSQCVQRCYRFSTLNEVEKIEVHCIFTETMLLVQLQLHSSPHMRGTRNCTKDCSVISEPHSTENFLRSPFMHI